MKKQSFLLPILLGLVIFSACENRSDDPTAITDSTSFSSTRTASTNVQKTTGLPNAVTVKTAILEKLQGKWQSTNDTSNYLLFTGSERKETGGGMQEWTTETYSLANRCQNSSGESQPLTTDIVYITVTESDMCWAILSIDEYTLSLSYVGRGNTLTYNKVR